MKKKVGVVTLHSAINYGVYLQAYAMQEKVKACGYEPEIIHYTRRNGNTVKGSKAGKMFGRLAHPKKTINIINNIKLRKTPQCQRRARGFTDFSAYKFNISRTCNDINDAKKIAERYDAVICGSDQIWNPVHTNCDPFYFMQFTDAKKVAYAPSIACREIPEEYKSSFNEYVNSFSSLSIRETSGAELVRKETGRECKAVVDPTLLFREDSWNKIACSKMSDEPYVFCYFLGYSETHEKLIEKAKKKFGCKIISTPFTYECSKNKNCENLYATIEEFLALVRDAEFVLTDSFHGVAFSTNYRKNFAVIKRSDTHPDKHLRVNDYLSKIGLENRVVTEETADEYDFSPIDYTQSSEMLEKWIDESSDYFEKSLSLALENDDNEKKNNILRNFMPDCYGCSACMAACPTDAIKMVKNDRGFLYPSVDDSKCINCGKCLKKCEINIENVTRCGDSSMTNYIAWMKDEKEIVNSSSGGMFWTAAEKFVNDGGYVCGAVYTEDFKGVHHIVSNDIEKVKKMRGSKYLQSDKENVFSEIKKLLDDGEKVFFTGAPCETAALRAFIGNEKNLLTMSYICHGPNSPKILEAYASDLEKKYNSKLVDFTTRYKKDGKILPLYIKADFENGSVHLEEYTYSAISRIFMSGYAMRNSCLKCKFKCFPPYSDIYVGDVQGKLIDVASFSEKGASYVFSSSEKGKQFLKSIDDKLNKSEVAFEKMVRNRNNILTPVTAPTFENADCFAENFEKYGLEETAEKMLPKASGNKKIIVKIKKLVKKIIKKFV